MTATKDKEDKKRKWWWWHGTAHGTQALIQCVSRRPVVQQLFNPRTPRPRHCGIRQPLSGVPHTCRMYDPYTEIVPLSHPVRAVHRRIRWYPYSTSIHFPAQLRTGTAIRWSYRRARIVHRHGLSRVVHCEEVVASP